jgi:GDP-mannose 6-dehydrogenase
VKVAVFGLGYVGSVTAAALARDGHEVVGCDVSPAKIQLLSAGKAPVLEPGLDDLIARTLKTGALRVTDRANEALARADLSMICVGTPSRQDDSIDLSHVVEVARQIGANLGFAAEGHVVVVRSTVLPGSARAAVIPEIEKSSDRKVGSGWDLCANPEFLREGSSLRDYDSPNRILVGERISGGAERVLALYKNIEADRFVVALETAEAIKYADNAFHALKITFANEIARAFEREGVDGRAVMEVVAADRKLNTSPAYLRPGFAFGGSCLPKDLRALTFAARRAGIRVPMLDAILGSNDIMIRSAVERVLSTQKRNVALLGLAFKPGTDDLRESPLVELAERLIGKGCELSIHDASVCLGRLHGSNRAFLEDRLPHVNRLLCDSVEEAVRNAAVVLIGHPLPHYAHDDAWRRQGKTVLRIA